LPVNLTFNWISTSVKVIYPFYFRYSMNPCINDIPALKLVWFSTRLSESEVAIILRLFSVGCRTHFVKVSIISAEVGTVRLARNVNNSDCSMYVSNHPDIPYIISANVRVIRNYHDVAFVRLGLALRSRDNFEFL